jgi:hypothetical protein
MKLGLNEEFLLNGHSIEHVTYNECAINLHADDGMERFGCSPRDFESGHQYNTLISQIKADTSMFHIGTQDTSGFRYAVGVDRVLLSKLILSEYSEERIEIPMYPHYIQIEKHEYQGDWDTLVSDLKIASGCYLIRY